MYFWTRWPVNKQNGLRAESEWVQEQKNRKILIILSLSVNYV